MKAANQRGYRTQKNIKNTKNTAYTIMADDCCIRILPDLLVNKIAAGEVVERPASIVKELLDNAIDAKATRIAVEVADGGKELIRVTDDGLGMNEKELRLAVVPHATSKLATEDDLFCVRTLGFRGEALASISSIARLSIKSRVRGADVGHEIRVTAEKLERAQAAGCPVGTSIEVRDLFFNVPARRKFLRKGSTEVGHINEQVARAALAFPHIAFELRNNNRITQQLPSVDSKLERIASYYGAELATALLHVHRQEQGIELEAYLAPPAQARASQQWQYTFVNGRYVRDRFVQHAVREAYRGLMEHARHAVVFLFLTVEPDCVDVNVHPTKIEVRWAQSGLIHSQVLSAIRETLYQADLTPKLRARHSEANTSPEEKNRIRQELAAMLKRETPIGGANRTQSNQAGAGPTNTDSRLTYGSKPYESDGADPLASWRTLYGQPTDRQAETSQAANEQAVLKGVDRTTLGQESDNRVAPPPRITPKAIQLHNLYLVAETDDGIVIIDQHALHERIIYEQLRTRIAQGTLEAQRLLLPETLDLTAKQLAVLENNAELLAKLGIECSAFGAEAVAVHAFPSILKNTAIREFMLDLVDYLMNQPAETNTETVIHAVLDMMACKAAVKAGDSLTDAEIEALIEQKHLIERSSSCPHGRPTTLRLTKRDLERQFKRT